MILPRYVFLLMVALITLGVLQSALWFGILKASMSRGQINKAAGAIGMAAFVVPNVVVFLLLVFALVAEGA